ncbi:MAG TPA: ABC transporter ATP-binding protein [Bacteroidia bacterium]
MGSLKHINKYLFKYRYRLLLGVVFVGISNYFAVNSIPYVRYTIDYLSADVKKHIPLDDIYHQLFIYGMYLLGYAFLSGVFLFLMRQTIIVMSRKIEYDLKNEIYEHYQKLDTAFYKRNNTGDMMNRISEDVGRVRMYIGPAIMYILNTSFLFLFTIGKMIDVDAKLTLFVLIPLPFLAISIYYVSNTISKKSTKVQEQLSNITTQTQEAFSGIRVLKAYGREEHFSNDFEMHSAAYQNRTMGLVKVEALFQPFMILLIGLSTIFTIYVGGSQAIAGKISYGNIAEFVVYVSRLTWPIASLGWVTSLIQRAAASQTRINEFLQTKPGITSSSTSTEKISGDIEFKEVSFTYPDSGITALKNVSFRIKRGSSLAIIGRTGSGKSTIANLICRLYDVESGSLLIDRKDIKEHNQSALRSQIGYAPQEVILFSDTISHNIAFSIDEEEQKKESIIQAAKDAAIYSNIIAFKEQFETVVGERGITLSGGQKQRISIARAIIKKPQIMIFDDCLSAVDTETEEEILNNLKKVMMNKTSLIISHRISTVKNADNIIVLDRGEIVESGTHQQLLEKHGVYFELHKMQLLEEELKS